MRKINYDKYVQILELKEKHTPESEIVATLECSYSTIRSALKWKQMGGLIPTTITTTPKIQSNSSERKTLDPEIKTAITTIFARFEQAMEIKPFLNLITEEDLTAITVLEKVI